MGRKPNPETWSRWRELVDAFELSDLTISDFCQEYGVSTASFYLWRRRFRESNLEADNPKPNSGSTVALESASLIPVQIRNCSSVSHSTNAGRVDALAVLHFSNSISMELCDRATVCEVAVELAKLPIGDCS